MKNFFLILIPALLLIPSCMNNDSVEPSVVEPGVRIYDKAKVQADLDMDPMVLALKLNTLIATADAEGKSYADVEVNIGGDGSEDGEDEEWVNLMERLFGTGCEVIRSGNEWTLDFRSTTAAEKERYYRSGDITIDTDGWMLDELDENRSWEVTVPSEGYDVVYTSGRVKYISRFDRYTITGTSAANNWTVEGYSTAYYDGYEQYASRWPFRYEVTMPGDGTFHWDDMFMSTIMVSGEGEGVPVYADYNVKYTAKDLKYKPRCYLWYIFGGVEYVQVERSEFTEEEMPDTRVKYTWFDASSSGTCYLSLIISYNGYSVNG
ncbi:MAG: hypothetical protein LIO77_01905 [Rikenellaceae bacterium]|nr:hypothetical protein [Rikenellaceae bacterium]